MFSEISLAYILLPALLIIMVIRIFFDAKLTRGLSDLDTALIKLKHSALAFGALLLVLLFALPSTPSLGTFGYPEIVDQINSDTKVLHYLQDYNRAIVRTTEVVHWALFSFIFLFIPTILPVVKSLKAKRFES